MSGETLHPRQKIRYAAFDILTDKLKNCVRSFSKNRFDPTWEKSELPAINIYTLQETAEIFEVAPRRLKRTLTLAVEVIVQSDDKADDILDQLSLAVENSFAENDTLNCTASDCVMTSTDLIQKPEGDTLTGSAILSFDVTYYMYAPEAQYLPPLKGIDFQIKVGEVDDEGGGTPQFKGKIDFEQE